jgi:hypothetical protein
MIGDKYQGKSHELVTKLKPKIKCQAYFSSPEPLKSASLLGNETALPFQGGIKGGNSTCVYTVAPQAGRRLRGASAVFSQGETVKAMGSPQVEHLACGVQ